MTSRHEKMTAAAVWLAGHGAYIGWGDAADGKAVKRHWKDDASNDPALIKAFLHGGRNALVIPAGRLVVVDIDRFGWYEKLKAADLPDTFTVMSPSVRRADDNKPAEASYTGETFRGVHVYLLAPTGLDVTTIASVWAGGETRRSEHGEHDMVLGPWSLRADGIYEPIPGTPRVLAEAPQAVFDFLAANPAKKAPLFTVRDPEGEFIWNEEYGSRHDHLRGLIRTWRGIDADRESLKRRTDTYIERHQIPRDRGPGGKTLDDAEVYELIDGALAKFADDPPYRGDQTQTIETESGESIVIDPLLVEMRVERPAPLELHDVMPLALYALVDHAAAIIDAPLSSLALVACSALGALFGPHPRLVWSGENSTQVFGVLVGLSGWGRKSGAMTVMEETIAQCDPLLPTIRRHGIASGEVLINILGKAASATPPEPTYFSEEEFVNVLVSAQRRDSTYSGNLRKAWDGRRIETHSVTRGSHSAEGYHVGVIGSITPSELAKHLSGNEIANGWANRFLWFWSERRDGGGADPTLANTVSPDLRKHIASAIDFARSLVPPLFMGVPLSGAGTMKLSDEAKAFLADVVEALDTPPIGSMGALQQRMPRHAVRLAMVAALLDLSSTVEVTHLRFGFRMTNYAVMSMNSVFGNRVDDPIARLVLDILVQAGPTGLNTAQIRRAVGMKDLSRVKSALDLLVGENLIAMTVEKPLPGSKGGRPAAVYRLAGG